MQGIQGKLKGVADVVICIDCTGSMRNCIEGVKGQLRTFVSQLESPPDPNTSKVDWRLKVMGFRDLNHDAEGIINGDAPFVTTAADAIAQIDVLKEQGGEDEPESALDAVWLAATRSEWRPKCTKVVALFSDAPSLPTLHSSTVALGAAGSDVHAVAQAISETGVRVFAWTPRCPVWEVLNSTTRVVHVPLPDADAGLQSVDFADLFKTLAKTVSQTAAAGPGIGGATQAVV